MSDLEEQECFYRFFNPKSASGDMQYRRVPLDFIGDLAPIEKFDNGDFSTQNTYGVLFLVESLSSSFMGGSMYRVVTTSVSTLKSYREGVISRDEVFSRGTQWLVSTDNKNTPMSVCPSEA